MTLDEFNLLDELEKDIFLDEIGIRLHMIRQNNLFVTLYSINDFFIEKRFNPLKLETKFVAFKDQKKLNKFIRSFKLPKI